MKYIVSNITYLYSSGKGIQNVTFTLDSGDVLAVIGCNGAGKTTLLKTLAGIYTPKSGTAEVVNKATTGNKSASFLISDEILIEKMSVVQMINYIIIMKSIKMSATEIDNILELFLLTEYKYTRIEELSTGNRKRLAILLTVLPDPDVVILDEPTNGLDTESVILLKRIIRRCSKKGKIIIVSSHILDFVSNVANKALILDRTGRASETYVVKDVDLEQLYVGEKND